MTVIWRGDELAVLKIDPDEDFIRDTIEKATTVFKVHHIILPELVGKWHTQVPSATQAVSTVASVSAVPQFLNL